MQNGPLRFRVIQELQDSSYVERFEGQVREVPIMKISYLIILHRRGG